MQDVRDEPRRRLRVERRALPDAEAVLLVDDDDREAVEEHVGLEQRVRADDERQLAGRELARACRRAASRSSSPVSSAVRTASPGMSAWSVAKCCSASTSVGAMNTACMSCSTARRIACSATTVLPDPTSPMSSRCIGRAVGELGVEHRDRRALVAGELERQQLLAPARRQARRLVERRARPDRPALRAAAQQRELGEQQLVERQPAAAALEVAGMRGDERGGSDRAARARAQARAGSGSTASCAASRCSRTSARICVDDSPIVVA